MVLLAKNERLAVEYTQRVEARREDVAAFYHDTKIYINPAHWQHLPKIKDVQQLTLFVDYIRKDPEPLSEQCIPVDAGRSAILDFVDKWIKEKRVHLRDILEKAQSAATPGLASQYKSMDVLDLATAVFLCRPRVSIYLDPNPCPALIGWDAVGPHLLCAENKVYVTHRHPAYENTFQFCRNGYHTVIQLLDLLKLDPLVTTAKDLDKLNARFICNSSGLTVCVFTWRECVWFPVLDHSDSHIPDLCERLILGGPCLSSANTHVEPARINLLCTHGRSNPICITPRDTISASRRSSLEL